MHNRVYASIKKYPKGRSTKVQRILNYPNSMLCKQKIICVIQIKNSVCILNQCQKYQHQFLQDRAGDSFNNTDTLALAIIKVAFGYLSLDLIFKVMDF